MELKPGIGFDNIKFGMTREEVNNLLGTPDSAVLNPNDENQVVLEWNALKTRLTFYKNENDRLGYLRIKNPALSYEGKSIFDIDPDSAKEILREKITDWNYDDYGFFQTYFNEQYWLTLQTEFGVIDEIEMGVPCEDNGEYIWP